MRACRVIPTYVLLILIAVTTVLPLVWMVFTSLHAPHAQIPTMRTLFTPDGWHFENYAHVLTYGELPVWRFAVNSFVVTAGVVVFQLVLCSLAAFGTFLLRQFFITLPQSLDDAARLDGCGDLRLFWHIILPSARPALATVAAFAFIWTWTDFYWPMLASSSTSMRTLEVGLSIFRDSYGGMQWSLQMAAAVIVLLPVLVFFLAMQRFFVRGVVLSGLKE
jgi:ABC-type glycerol-3-phosphate transport system permease component